MFNIVILGANRWKSQFPCIETMQNTYIQQRGRKSFFFP